MTSDVGVTSGDTVTAVPPEGRHVRSRGPVRPRLTRRQRLSKWDVKLSPYLYVSPFFVVFLAVGMFPLCYTVYVSVFEWGLLSGQGAFIGLDNYRAVLEDPTFMKALVNTISIFLLSSGPQILMALLLAGLLDTRLRGRTFWRMSILLPFVVAPVAVAIIFGSVYGDEYGLINQTLERIGVEPIEWHTDRFASHVAIASMVNWRWTGYNALIFLAAMQAVPRDLYESAEMDGAGRIRQFLSVTLPMIRPTFIFVVITSTIGGLQIFAEPRLFDDITSTREGGPDHQWTTMTMHIYNTGWGRGRDLGEASAIACLLFGIIIVFALANYLAVRRFAKGGDR